MKIALYSDIHTEFWSRSEPMPGFFENAKECDVVVLAGDIAVGRTNVLKILKKFAKHYPHVIYTPGNHEYYNSSIDIFNDFPEAPKNVYYLNPGVKHISDRHGDLAAFIVAPLWTNFRNSPVAEEVARLDITDFRLISGLSPASCAAMFEEHSKFIKDSYDKIKGKKVIVTHFLPAVECISPRFRDTGLINYYFANDMGNWISTLSNTTWMFGHTHDSVDFMLGDTRMVCNPYGYDNVEINRQFSHKVIEV